MSRLFTTARCFGLLVLFAVALVGCDETPNSPESFRLQGTMDSSPSSFTASSEVSPEFAVDFQGLQGFPTAEIASEAFELDRIAEEGSPENGERRWRLSVTGEIQETLIREPVLIRGTDTEGREIVDTLSVFATSVLSLQADFTSSFYTFADYEGDVTMENYALGEDFTPDEIETEPYEFGQRTIETSGGTQFQLTNPEPDPGLADGENSPEGSNGVRFMQVDGSPDGSLTIERRMNLPNSNFFSFLIQQANDPFTLTLTLTEETGGGTADRQIAFTVPPGSEWLKIGVPFSEINESLNPVDSRSGGNGPLVSVRLSADANVQYAVDEMLFGVGPTEQEPFRARAELHDFEASNLAFGPPFSPANSFGFSTVGDEGGAMVANESDGYTARTIDAGFFGYDTGGGGFPPPNFVRVDVDGDDVLSMLVKDVEGGGEFTVQLRSSEGFFQDVTRGGFPQGEWQRVEIPISELGDPPVALDPGLSGINFGVSTDGTVLVDDIKIMAK